MKNLKKISLIPSLILYSQLSSAMDRSLTISPDKAVVFRNSISEFVVLTDSGRIVHLDANKIRDMIEPLAGAMPLNELEILVHRETDEIIISDRNNINIYTDIRELSQCCPNLRSIYRETDSSGF